MKCAICGKKIEATFMGKIIGAYVGKKAVCNECQKKHPSRDELLKALE